MGLRLLMLGVVIVVVLALVTGGAPTSSGDLPSDELLVRGQSTWQSGARTALQVKVQRHIGARGIAYSPVRLVLVQDESPQVLATGKTDANGDYCASFEVPSLPEGTYTLQVRARTSNGTLQVERPVELVNRAKVLLYTDKPLYQPGQVVHMRALLQQAGTQKALAGRKITFLVEDPKGNRVFKRTQETKAFGVAAADFQLADEVNLGTYHLRVEVGEDSVERTVEVKRYVLPKFKVNLSADKTWYLPAEVLKVRVQVDYFFGKPVSHAKVKLACSTFDTGLHKFAELQGTTDAKGYFEGEIELPASFVGQPFTQGKATVQVEAEVTDSARHTERVTQVWPVVAQPLQISVIPEAGRPVAGLENRFYVLTTYPDGQPAECKLKVTTPTQSLACTTDETGFGQFALQVKQADLHLEVQAQALKGPAGSAEFDWSGGEPLQPLLLRADKALARAGERLTLTAYAPGALHNIYFDAVKNAQTVFTAVARVRQGKATLEVPLTPDLVGAVTFHSYVVEASGDLVSAAKRVVVLPAEELQVEVKADKKVYRPAEEATFDFTVKTASGRPFAACLGLAVVDESVFALSEAQPGLARLYFLLEKQLMEPKYEIHGVSLKGFLERPLPRLEAPKTQHLAEALLASVPTEPLDFSLQADSFLEAYSEQVPAYLRQLADDARRLSKALRKHPPIAPEGGLLAHCKRLVAGGKLSKAALLDPWGNYYKLEGRGREFELTSAGPDGQFDTLDDLGPFYSFALCNFKGFADLKPEKIARLLATGELHTLLEGRGGWGGGMPGIMFDKGAVALEAMPAPKAALAGAKASDHGRKPVHIRQFFPETLYWNPALFTDERGKAQVKLKLADSITSWRMSVVANTGDGLLGGVTAPVRVFQPFFVDLDLPEALTYGDELSVPVAVYNYLKHAQQVKLELECGEGFKLLDVPVKTLQIAAGEVSVVYFRLKAQALGEQKLTVFASSGKVADAVRRSVRVVPNGKLFEQVSNGRLLHEARLKVQVPDEAVAGATTVFLRLYPGALSQALEGLDKLLGMPFGCFEQTTSITYPNALVLQYLEQAHKANPELSLKAEQYLNIGYQRMLSFEVEGGGFEWFGNAPANKLLTAWGLMAFHDMAKVFPVDEAVISRTQEWLAAQQAPDGAFKPDKEYLHAEHWSQLQNGDLLPTAYVAWALASTGYKGAALKKALDYVAEHADSADTAYQLALCAEALAAAEPGSARTRSLVERLVALAKHEGDLTWWEAGMATASYSTGPGADVETTALSAMALYEQGDFTPQALQALNWLVQKRDASGGWYSTTPTILALRALLAASSAQAKPVKGILQVKVGGKPAGTLELTPEQSDVTHVLNLSRFIKPGTNELEVTLEGEGKPLYQVVTRYYLPWKHVPASASRMLDLKVSYDRTRLAQDDLATCVATITNKSQAELSMVMVDLGVPPGFAVQAGDLAELKGDGVFQKYMLTGRQVTLYFDKLAAGQQVVVKYRLKALFPVKVQVPASTAWQYYAPEERQVVAPQELVVQ